MKPHRKPAPPGFVPGSCHMLTLVELVVVMVIMLILMLISVGGFRSMSTASKVDGTASNLSSTIHNSRLQAIALRRYVAVIMPGTLAGLNDYQYRCFRQAIVTPAAGGKYEFVKWMDNSAWEFLPQGVSIMEADNDIGIQADSSGTMVFTKSPQDNSPVLTTAVDMQQPFGMGSTINNLRAIVFTPEGKLAGTANYITIGRAVFQTNGFWRVDNPASAAKNISCADQVTLEINRYTGRTKFLTWDQY